MGLPKCPQFNIVWLFLCSLCWQQVERDLNHGKQQQQLQQAHGQLQLSQFALPQDHCQPQGSAASVPSVLPQFLNMDIAIQQQQQQQQQQQGMLHNYSPIELGVYGWNLLRSCVPPKKLLVSDILSREDSRKFTRLSNFSVWKFPKCVQIILKNKKVTIFFPRTSGQISP